MKNPLLASALACLSLLTLCQCSVLGPVLEPSKVIYALSSQNVPSPLEKELEAAYPSIPFSRDHFLLSKRQHAALIKQVDTWKAGGHHLLIVGFAQRGFPASYARSLSQRRAESVRQALIEEGIDAAMIHSTGFGHDQPTLSSADEVRIYFAK